MKYHLIIWSALIIPVHLTASAIDVSELQQEFNEKDAISFSDEQVLRKTLSDIKDLKINADDKKIIKLASLYLGLNPIKADNPAAIFQMQEEFISLGMEYVKKTGSKSVSLELEKKLMLFSDQLSKQVIENYTDFRVTANVAPPSGIFGVAGMDPKDIKNLTARAEYEAAIAANSEHIRVNSYQASLRKILPLVKAALQEISNPPAR